MQNITSSNVWILFSWWSHENSATTTLEFFSMLKSLLIFQDEEIQLTPQGEVKELPYSFSEMILWLQGYQYLDLALLSEYLTVPANPLFKPRTLADVILAHCPSRPDLVYFSVTLETDFIDHLDFVPIFDFDHIAPKLEGKPSHKPGECLKIFYVIRQYLERDPYGDIFVDNSDRDLTPHIEFTSTEIPGSLRYSWGTYNPNRMSGRTHFKNYDKYLSDSVTLQWGFYYTHYQHSAEASRRDCLRAAFLTILKSGIHVALEDVTISRGHGSNKDWQRAQTMIRVFMKHRCMRQPNLHCYPKHIKEAESLIPEFEGFLTSLHKDMTFYTDEPMLIAEIEEKTEEKEVEKLVNEYNLRTLKLEGNIPHSLLKSWSDETKDPNFQRGAWGQKISKHFEKLYDVATWKKKGRGFPNKEIQALSDANSIKQLALKYAQEGKDKNDRDISYDETQKIFYEPENKIVLRTFRENVIKKIYNYSTYSLTPLGTSLYRKVDLGKIQEAQLKRTRGTPAIRRVIETSKRLKKRGMISLRPVLQYPEEFYSMSDRSLKRTSDPRAFKFIKEKKFQKRIKQEFDNYDYKVDNGIFSVSPSTRRKLLKIDFTWPERDHYKFTSENSRKRRVNKVELFQEMLSELPEYPPIEVPMEMTVEFQHIKKLVVMEKISWKVNWSEGVRTRKNFRAPKRDNVYKAIYMNLHALEQ